MSSAMDIHDIIEHLPHRYPFLLVDRVISVEPGKDIVALKNVTINEPFFPGHYPHHPVMPGVLIIEAIAQAGAILLLSDPDHKGKIPLIGSFDNVKFKKPVVPGDQLISDCKLVFFRSGVGKFAGEASVDGEVVASMECTFKLVDELKIG